MTKFLNIEHLEKICFEYAKTHPAHAEPIPPFLSRFQGKLEAALGAPQRTFNNSMLYPTLERQAAVLFYELIKLHPFENGNKRIATVSLLVFLSLNKKWITTTWKELYDIAILVADSKTERRDGALRLLEEFIKNNTKKE